MQVCWNTIDFILTNNCHNLKMFSFISRHDYVRRQRSSLPIAFYLWGGIRVWPRRVRLVQFKSSYTFLGKEGIFIIGQLTILICFFRLISIFPRCPSIWSGSFQNSLLLLLSCFSLLFQIFLFLGNVPPPILPFCDGTQPSMIYMYAFIATLFLQTVVEDVSWKRYKKTLQSMTHLDNDAEGERKKNSC